MSRSKLIWGGIIVSTLVVSSFDASGFNPRLEPQPQPVLKIERNREVVILDNDYLDRRFGSNRSRESNITDTADSTPIGRGVFIPGGPQVVDVPPPRRPADILPDASLLKGIGRNTPARRAAALRLAETGRTLLQKGQNRRAIYYLERALGMDASPFFHFYLARAHYQLADYGSSRRFLQVAESGFDGQPEWLSEVGALKEVLSGFAARPALHKRNVAWTFDE
jgi:hypothetical protein